MKMDSDLFPSRCDNQTLQALQKAGPLAVELEIGRFKDFSQMHRDDPVFRGPWGFDNPEISGNHAVLLVGTCEDLQGRPCFEMQNSWGTDFCDEVRIRNNVASSSKLTQDPQGCSKSCNGARGVYHEFLDCCLNYIHIISVKKGDGVDFQSSEIAA